MPGRLSRTRTAVAGLVGAGAVAGAMACARRAGLTRLEFPRILATILGGERPLTRAAGWALFVGNGAALAFVYRAVLRRSGGEGSVSRGTALGLAHGAVAAGGAAVLSPLHPRPRLAGLDDGGGPRPAPGDLAALVAVHVVYGAVLGAFASGRT